VDDELLAVAKAAIGSEYELTPEQSRRLRGDTASELRADAKAMRGELGLPPLDKNDRDERGRFAGSSMNEIIRRASGRVA
jgi:hypothetical protein